MSVEVMDMSFSERLTDWAFPVFVVLVCVSLIAMLVATIGVGLAGR